MTRIWEAIERPAGLAARAERRDCELVRAGREGTYWQAADGLVVRLAAAEDGRCMEEVQRELLALAVRDAVAQGPQPAAREAGPADAPPTDRAAVFVARAEGNAGRTCT
jgi:hypothetical protein